MNVDTTISRLDRRYGPMRLEDADGELGIEREQPQEFEPFEPDWHETGEAGA